MKENLPFIEQKNKKEECWLEQYTKKNCSKVKLTFNFLLSDLFGIGEEAKESKKVETFENALLSLNTPNDSLDGAFIELRKEKNSGI